MKHISNIGLVQDVRNHILEGLKEVDNNTKVYSVKHPSNNLPNSFILVKSLSQSDRGELPQNGVIEVCLYAKNRSLKDDQTQPDLSTIKSLIDLVYPLLDDAIIQGTAITSIRSTTVSDDNNRYHYESLICETFSVKQTKI